MKNKFLILSFISMMTLSENALAVVSGNCGSRSGSGTTQDPYVYADNCQWTLDNDTGEMTISGTGNMYYAEYDYNQNKTTTKPKTTQKTTVAATKKQQVTQPAQQTQRQTQGGRNMHWDKHNQ